MVQDSPVNQAVRYIVFFSICALLLTVAFSPQTLGLQVHTLPEIEELPPLVPRDLIFGAARTSQGPLWVAGNAGKILLSENGGETWNEQETPVRSDLMDVDSWNRQKALAVGNEGTVLRTDNGGEAWSEVESPYSETVNSRGINKLLRISLLDDGYGYAVGQWNMIMETQDYGRTWSRITSSTDVNLYGLEAINRNLVFGVGELGKILRGTRTDDGNWNWETLKSPVRKSLKAVEFRNDQAGIIVGSQGTVLRTTDGGASWTVVHEDQSTGHLYAAIWTGEQWLAIGGNGSYVLSQSDEDQWKASQLARDQFGWHSDLVSLDPSNRQLIVGEDIGTFDVKNKEWERYRR